MRELTVPAVVGVDDDERLTDMVVDNAGEMPDLVSLLRPGAQMILSGILEDRGRQVLSEMRGLGFVEIDRREAGEWVAFRVGMEPGAF